MKQILTVRVISQHRSNNIGRVRLTGCILSDHSVFVFLSKFKARHLKIINKS